MTRPLPREHMAEIAQNNGWTVEEVAKTGNLDLRVYKRDEEVLWIGWNLDGTGAGYIGRNNGDKVDGIPGPTGLITVRKIMEAAK